MKKKLEKEKNTPADIFKNESMKLFTMLGGYFLLVLVLYTGFQILNINKNCLGIVQLLSVLIPITVYLLAGQQEKSLKKRLITIVSYLLILLVLPFIYNKTYDLTVDGNSYHKTAIAFIKNGWNPIYESSREFQKNNNEVVKIAKDSKIDLWIEHYPKATWILAANIYNMTGNIESGKCITLIFSIMLLIISYNCLSKILDKKWTIILSALIVLNPITLGQLFSYYVDGLMGIFFAIEILLLFLIKPLEKQNKWIWLSLISICTIFTNLKFTGLLCSGVIAAVFYFYWLIKYHQEKEFWLRFRNITFHFIVVFATAIFFVGANSYVKNLVDHHNPLYPLIGKDKVDIITTMQPKSFKNKNIIEKFTISLFSKTENVTYESKGPKLKLPFRVYSSEFDELMLPDVRIGGFGPLFTLSLLVSILILIPSIVILIKKEKENLKYLILPLIAMVLSMILLGEAWWARYVPQFYLFPLGAILLAVYVSKYINKKNILKGASLAIIAILLVNLWAFFNVVYSQLKSFKDVSADLITMRRMNPAELKLGTEGLYGYYYNLKDNNINYKVVKKIKPEEKRYFYSWRFEVRVNEELSKTN